MRRIRVIAAAAIIGALICGGGFWAFKEFGKSKSAVLTSQIPNFQIDHQGAILTLADGRQVLLDSTGKRILASGNGVQVEVENGQLKYKANQKTTKVIENNTLATPPGVQFHVVLPDGSKVWLNASSSITYPVTFVKGKRAVTISGEVYFEITKRPDMGPFVVTSPAQKVTVLGTHFNISSSGRVSKTTLVEGRVQIVAAGQPIEKVLYPGQQAAVSENKPIEIKNVDVETELAWRRGYFNLNNTPFEDILQQISQWYGIQVRYENRVPNIELGGKIKQSVDLSNILEFFKNAGVKFKMEDKTLIILSP